LRDIDRALDRLGVEAFIPHTRRFRALRASVRTRRVAVPAERAASRAVPHATLRPRGVMKGVFMRALVVMLVVAAGCSTTAVRQTATSEEPVGCCCAYGDCRERLTQEECASVANFQGWTYAWHAGPCTETDGYPASDRS